MFVWRESGGEKVREKVSATQTGKSGVLGYTMHAVPSKASRPLK